LSKRRTFRLAILSATKDCRDDLDALVLRVMVATFTEQAVQQPTQIQKLKAQKRGCSTSNGLDHHQ
jgi:hypothetical protein